MVFLQKFFVFPVLLLTVLHYVAIYHIIESNMRNFIKNNPGIVIFLAFILIATILLYFVEGSGAAGRFFGESIIDLIRGALCLALVAVIGFAISKAVKAKTGKSLEEIADEKDAKEKATRRTEKQKRQQEKNEEDDEYDGL